jgi:serine/threonine protein kinase
MTGHGDSPESFGAYELLEQIGCGGTATVYRARRRDNGQLVALKIGAQLLALAPASLQRFKREFTVMRDLRHPSLVRALEFGEMGQVPYLVLEFVTGLSLDKVLQQDGPLPLSRAVRVFLQIAEGLRFLHKSQVLHRDIKPGNIFLTARGNAKLGDFGLLKALNSESSITVARQGMGTFEYGAPEQFEDAKHADCRCDFYSLAATLYSALTGLFPFGVGSQMRIFQRKLLNQLVPLHYVLPKIPAELDDLVTRSMQAEREERPASLDEFVAVLRNIKPSRIASPAPGAPKPGVARLATKIGAGKDRRGSARISVTLPVAYVPYHQHQRGTLKATVVDVSSGGLCLKTNAPLPVNTLLEVTAAKGLSCLAQIRWVKTTPNQEYILGCSFTRLLNPRTIEEIFQLRSP